MRKKKLYSIGLIVLLILSLFPFANFTADHVNASTSMKKRVLEIVDNGGSKLTNLVDLNLYEIETVRMKQFVALREELDGKYDLIVISEGTYSPNKLGQTTNSNRSASHNTTNLNNDITILKADEMIKDYINKNQLVIFHNDIFKVNGILNQKFNTYKTNSKNNVKMITHMSEVPTVITNFYSQNHSRPRIQVSEKPEGYPNGKEYQANEKISFSFDVTKQSNQELTANLYLDANFNHRFEPSELIQSVPILSNHGSLEYTLPKGYSGLRYWKLEIVDSNSGLKDYATGVFKFKGEKVTIKVLQVTTGENDGSRLTLAHNMNPSYLSNEDYEIRIDTVSMLNFSDAAHPFSHTKLNGNYDMLIFGFNDEYNRRTTLGVNAAASVQAFINTGQSVMFTHDTIFETNNIWVNNFMDATGQISPLTNLGYGAPLQSETTKKVNEGLLTQFPFHLGENIQIKNTHNQYYTLDLEDPAIIPWYNIIGGNRDVNDSWNHYYTYSKGNITYSGTGHTNNRFPDDEQRLFVNTMFRAFLGANTAPFVNVITPSNDRIQLSSQDLELVYEAYDLDLTDRTLKTRVYLNHSTTPIFENDDVPNGAIVRPLIKSEYLQAGPNVIRIEIEDQSGAIAFEERTIDVQEAELTISKSLSKTKAAIEEEITVNYSISVNDSSGFLSEGLGSIFPYAVVEDALTSNTDIPVADSSSTGNYGWLTSAFGTGANNLRNAVLQEIYLEVAVGATVNTEPGNMRMVRHVRTWLNGQEKQVILPIVSEYPNGRKDVVVKDLGLFTMYQSGTNVFLKYEGSARGNGSIDLSNLVIEEYLPNGIEIVRNGTDQNVEQEESSNGTKITIKLDNISLEQLYEQGPIEFEYTIKASQPGIYLMDQSHFSYQIDSNEYSIPFNAVTLEVVRPVSGVEIRNTSTDMIVGENPRRLFFDIVPENATNKHQAENSAVWSSSDPSVVSIDQNGYITAHKVGEAVITVAIADIDHVNNGVPFTSSLVFHAIIPLDGIVIEGNSNLFVGDKETFTVRTLPTGIPLGPVEWEIISGHENIEINRITGEVTAKNHGIAKIEAKTEFKGKIFTSERIVNSKRFSIDPNSIEINIGQKNSSLKARVYHSNGSTENVTATWSSSNNTIATVDSTSGEVTGIGEGTATITAQITENGINRVASATVTVFEVSLDDLYSDPVIIVEKGKSKFINVTFEPSNATNKAVEFTIDQSSYATVDKDTGEVTGHAVRYGFDQNGALTAITAATVTITSKENPDITLTVDVVVVEEEDKPNGWRW